MFVSLRFLSGNFLSPVCRNKSNFIAKKSDSVATIKRRPENLLTLLITSCAT